MSTTKPIALLVEDDVDLAQLLCSHLREEGILVTLAHDGAEAFERLRELHFTIAILDRNLPDLDGVELCKHIRKTSPTTGVILLTCIGQTSERVRGLNAGADDYIAKPFSIDELLARTQSVIRRATSNEKTPPLNEIHAGELSISKITRNVLFKGEKLELTETEFDLLVFLAENPGVKFSRTELLHNVWGYTSSGYEHTINTRINRLRMKLKEDTANPSYIITVWGVGYKFSEDLPRHSGAKECGKES